MTRRLIKESSKILLGRVSHYPNPKRRKKGSKGVAGKRKALALEEKKRVSSGASVKDPPLFGRRGGF